MTEDVRSWWRRRQFSRGAEVPYAVGTYRAAWRPFPVLVRMFHPDLNRGIALSQIPPAADVYLVWQCDSGHLVVATPEEQRMRPGRERRRSSWCAECSAEATGTSPDRAVARAFGRAGITPAQLRDGGADAAGIAPAIPPPRRTRRPPPRLCPLTPSLPVGSPFTSGCAPAPASAVEAQLRAALRARLEFDTTQNAVRLRRPFFEHLEAWPDLVLGDLRVAIEWDSTGRHGLEHVGQREDADRRKDRALRAAGWEVIRLRSAHLPRLGPHDLEASAPNRRLVSRVLDELRVIRGPLLVDAYLA